MNVYAYCLSDEIDAELAETLAGIGGAAARLVWCGRIAAVVSDFDGDAVAVTRDNVLAHERVVGGVLARATPLPFRFGTVVTEERLAGYVASQSRALRAPLERVRGCVEMSVKVIWKEGEDEPPHSDPRSTHDRQPARLDPPSPTERQPPPDHQASSDPQSPNAGRRPPDQATPGTTFLLAKRRELAGEATRVARAREIAEWLASRVGRAVRDSRIDLNPRSALVVSAAHLVERARLEEYRELLRGARAARLDLHFLTSGAWPPYSFTNTRA